MAKLQSTAKLAPTKLESKAKRSQRIATIVERLAKAYPDAKAGLDYSNSFELLFATILSAQCTDERVNSITPKLFAKYPTPEAVLEYPQEELEADIYVTGFYKNKAKNIRACCRKLVDEYDSTVPSTLDELVGLPGVGRKTANCVLSNCYNVPGLTVDTHVIRITNLLKLVSSTDPVKIEYELMELMPDTIWNTFNHVVIAHGRRTCIARRPICTKCTITDLCPSAFLPQSR